MWKKFSVLIVLLSLNTFSWAQLAPKTHAHAVRAIDQVLQRAYAAQTAQNKISPFQEPKQQRPWQLALFLAARNRDIDETLTEIKGKMNWENVKLAAILDLTPDNNTSTQKCNCEKGSCKKPLASPQQITLYVLYRDGMINRQEKYTFPLSNNPDVLWKELLAKLKTGDKQYQTGVIIDAHASGYHFFYGKDNAFAAETVLRALASSKLHVDLLELHACHMSSLRNIYHWTKNTQIDYVVASSDICTDSNSHMYYRVLRFLKDSPRQAAISSVKDRMNILHATNSTSTNNVSALSLAPLRRPLQNYVTEYKELFSFMGTEEMDKTFAGYFTDEYNDWKSLRAIVKKQRDYVNAHLEPEMDSFYPQQLKFIAACDELLKSLSSATLAQWCYSQKDKKIYQGNAPATSGCLDSVSTSSAQFWSFW